MTELRDARFHKALESAPDALERPAPQIAESIRAAAHSAVVQPAVAVPEKANWWRQFWEGVGSPRSPWSAALATVVLGVLITTLWVHEPIPDARAPIASAPVLAPVPPVSLSESTPPPMPTPAQPSPTEPSARLADAAPQAASKAARTAPASTDAAVQQASRAAELAVAAAPAATSVAPPAPAAGAVPVPSPAPAPAPVPAPAQAPVELARKEAAVDSANRMAANESAQGAVTAHPAAPPAAATAPAAPAAPPAALSLAPAEKKAAPSLAPSARFAAPASGLGPWTAVDVQVDGRSATLDAQQAQALMRQAQNLEALLPPETSTPPATPAIAPDLQLTLRVQDRVIATLTLRGNAIRWQRERRLTLSGTLEEAQAQQLLQLAREALAGINNPKSPP